MTTKRKDPADHLPNGRPSLYEIKHCEAVIELGKQGKSFTQIACAIGFGRATLQRWADEHPEFRDAITRAKEFEQDWWETKGQSSLEVERFNAAVWKKSMEARFRDDYTERRDVSTKISLSHEDALAMLD